MHIRSENPIFPLFRAGQWNFNATCTKLPPRKLLQVCVLALAAMKMEYQGQHLPEREEITIGGAGFGGVALMA
jgi:hypothetical protein